MACSFHAPSTCATLLKSPRVYQPRNSLNPILSGYLKGSSHKYDPSDPRSLATDPPSSSSSPRPHGGQGGAESFNPLVIWYILPATSPHPLMQSKSQFIDKTKDAFVAYHSGNSKGVRSPVSKTRTKTKYIFLIINHNIISHKKVMCSFQASFGGRAQKCVF